MISYSNRPVAYDVTVNDTGIYKLQDNYYNIKNQEEAICAFTHHAPWFLPEMCLFNIHGGDNLPVSAAHRNVNGKSQPKHLESVG